jgi:hypothetical protein
LRSTSREGCAQENIVENKNDRVLVIIGNGHAAILRQLIESSPEFEFYSRQCFRGSVREFSLKIS